MSSKKNTVNKLDSDQIIELNDYLRKIKDEHNANPVTWTERTRLACEYLGYTVSVGIVTKLGKKAGLASARGNGTPKESSKVARIEALERQVAELTARLDAIEQPGLRLGAAPLQGEFVSK